tara:strand:+ start:228 stop:587 length:360 start_codon:yes stop_codon:yes gene_type:complete
MKTKVLYNRSCNICKSEIDHYQKLNSNDLIFVNIVNNKKVQILTSKSYEQLIRRLHIIKNGEVISGAEAFLEIWKNIPRYRFLYLILKFKPFFMLFNFFYEIIAYFLFIKNKHLLNKDE